MKPLFLRTASGGSIDELTKNPATPPKHLYLPSPLTQSIRRRKLQPQSKKFLRFSKTSLNLRKHLRNCLYMSSDTQVPDFYDRTGKLALGSRLRRLSEQMTEQAHAIYDLYQVPLQPKWFPVFYSLSSTE